MQNYREHAEQEERFKQLKNHLVAPVIILLSKLLWIVIYLVPMSHEISLGKLPPFIINLINKLEHFGVKNVITDVLRVCLTILSMNGHAM